MKNLKPDMHPLKELIDLNTYKKWIRSKTFAELDSASPSSSSSPPPSLSTLEVSAESSTPLLEICDGGKGKPQKKTE